jgi:hypothetical protein
LPSPRGLLTLLNRRYFGNTSMTCSMCVPELR